MAFRTAGRIGMSEGLAQASPILLEPIEKLVINTPNAATARITSSIVQQAAARSSATTRATDWRRAGTASRSTCPTTSARTSSATCAR